jgi:hypothetical protein
MRAPRAVTGRHRLSRRAEKHLVGPPLRLLLRLGLAPRAFALLETTGRRTGRRRLTPVGNGLDGELFWLVAARGHQVVRGKPGRRPAVPHQGRPALACRHRHVSRRRDALARRTRLDQANGIIGRLDGLAFRATAARPVTIRVELDPAPPQ